MLKFDNVSLKIENNFLFQDLSFEFNQETTVCFVGPSGTGKSSLFNLLMGFLKPHKGKISILNQELNKYNIAEIRRKIAWLPQGGFLSSGKVIDSFNYIFNFNENKHIKLSKEKINNYLDGFALDTNILLRDTNNISGGEKQRLGLILTILLDREIILLDEPTSALDKKNINNVIKYFLGKNNKLVLSISHDEKWIKKNKKIIKLS